MSKVSTVRPGQIISHDGDLWAITKMYHGTPGNKGGFYQVTMKNVTRGNTITTRFRPEDDVEVAYLDTRRMEYLYKDGELYCFMDVENYEQVMLSVDIVGECMPYIKENQEIGVRFLDGKAINVELPTSVVLRVTKTDPGVKGNTVSNYFKPAELETGLNIKAPLYINQGEQVKIDTRTGDFIERAKE